MKALLVALATLLPIASFAQTDAAGRNSTSYLQVRLGAVIPQHEDLDGYDSGLAFDVGIGFFLNPNVAIEAGLGRFSISAEDSYYDYDLAATVTARDTASAIPLTGTLKLGAPIEDKAFLYGLAGAGLYFVSDTFKISAPGYGSASEDDSATAFGLHFGGGASLYLAPRWTIGAEVRYLVSKVELFEVSSNIDSLVATANVGYRF